MVSKEGKEGDVRNDDVVTAIIGKCKSKRPDSRGGKSDRSRGNGSRCQSSRGGTCGVRLLVFIINWESFPFQTQRAGYKARKGSRPLVFEVLLEMFRPERSKNQGRRIKKRSEGKRRDHSFK